MSDEPPAKSELVFYQTEDGRTRIHCRFEADTVWMTQAQMAELFQTTLQNVTLHLKVIFAEGELAEAATCKDYLQVRPELARPCGQCFSGSSAGESRGGVSEIPRVSRFAAEAGGRRF